MSALGFDTYKAVTALKQAGFAEGQAEAVVTTVGEALSGNVATKADLTEGRAALQADIQAVKADIQAVKTEVEQVRSETKADLAALETRLTKHIYGVVLAGVGLTVTLTTILLRLLQQP